MKIEKNIAVTPIRPGKGSPTHTLRRMSDGDSVAVHPSQFSIWRSCANNLGVKLIARTITPTEGRIWLKA